MSQAGAAPSIATWVAAQLATVGRTVVLPGSAQSAGTVDASPLTIVSRNVSELRTPHPPRATDWLLSYDGQLMLAVAGEEGFIHILVLDPDTGTVRTMPSPAAGIDRIHGLAWYQDTNGMFLATCGADAEVRVWTVNSHGGTVGVPKFRSEGRKAVRHGLAWQSLPNGGLVLTAASSLGDVNLWDVSGRSIRTRLASLTINDGNGVAGLVSALASTLGADRRILLATGGRQGTVSVSCVDPMEGKHELLCAVEGHADAISSMDWCESADGRLLLATSSLDKTARTWAFDQSTRVLSEVAVLSDHENVVRTAVWCVLPDGRPLLVTASLDRTVRVWDPGTGGCIGDFEQPFPVHEAAVVVVPGRRPGEEKIFVCAVGGLDLVQISALEVSGARSAAPGAPAPLADETITAGPPQRIDSRQIHAPQIQAIRGGLSSSAVHETPDGRLLLVTGASDGVLRIWDLDDAGGGARLLDSIDTFADGIKSLAWQALPDGHLLLAATSRSGWAWLWEIDPSSGTIQRQGSIGPPVLSSTTVIDWCLLPDGRLLLAAGDRMTPRVVICEVNLQSLLLSELTTFLIDAPPSSLAWHLSPGSDPLLACGGSGFGITLSKVDISRGLVSEHPIQAAMADVSHVAWLATPDGRLLLAGLNRREPAPGTGLNEPYRVNDIGVFEIDVPGARTTLVQRLVDDSPSAASSLSWCRLPGGSLLIVARAHRALQVWGLEPTGHELSLWLDKQLPQTSWGQQVSCHLTRTGRLLCVISGIPLHEGQIVELFDRSLCGAPRTTTPRLTIGTSSGLGARRCSVTGMVQLGAAGMWLGMGLIDDIVSMTGSANDSVATGLNDPRLGGALSATGLDRLRKLRWPPAARVGFAGLLCSGLPAVAEWTPPEGTAEPELLRALIATSAVVSGGVAAPTDVRAVVSASGEVDDQVVRLLEMLGPRRVAADPMMPLRLLDRARQLPTLPARLRLMLAARGCHELKNVQAGGVERSLNSVPIVVRHGRPDRLVPAHLALALSVGAQEQAVLEAGQELLYRRYTVPSSPPLRPVALVLDTSPPTFGPIEMVLRTVAHLAVVMLWRARVNPMLITLTHPAHAQEVSSADGLMEVWTSRTLASPDPGAAMATAASTGLPVVVLTTHQVAWAHLSERASNVWGTSARFVTTHGPRDQPPAAGKTGTRHFHLPLDPGPEHVTRVLTELLTP